MTEKHTVHLRSGGKVTISGEGRVELHLSGPLIFQRKDWVQYLANSEEARRAISYSNVTQDITNMLAEAFQAVPMVVHPEDD